MKKRFTPAFSLLCLCLCLCAPGLSLAKDLGDLEVTMTVVDEKTASSKEIAKTIELPLLLKKREQQERRIRAEERYRESGEKGEVGQAGREGKEVRQDIRDGAGSQEIRQEAQESRSGVDAARQEAQEVRGQAQQGKGRSR